MKNPNPNPNPNPKRPTRHAYRIVAFNTVIEFGTAVYRNAQEVSVLVSVNKRI